LIPPEQSGFALDPSAGAQIEPSSVLAGLNEAQREAVVHPGGPLLVLAGAGSGKTRVITHKIAYLILERGVQPDRLVAVTFTNKAAGEMGERVERLLGRRILGSWIGTFHALCLRILRCDGARIGLDPEFNVYDTDDQLALIKRILRNRDDQADAGTPRSFLSRISRARNGLQRPEEIERTAFSPERRRLVEIYRAYVQALRQANAVDFDDLLLLTLDLFNDHPDIAERYASRCEHLLVDEYQDTNRPQYLLIRHLSRIHDNVCVVGDEDQSIYRFRGAEIRNILDFERDHSGAQTIRLERNYRSTGTIIDAAGAVIARNILRKGKTLWTDNAKGEPLELFRAPDDRVEAVWVAQSMRTLEADHPLERMAVLYRTNAQSRQFEEVFRREGIPHQIVGSVRFYERKEVKDLLAYLKLAVNPADDVAFRRVVNTPSRGIGATTLRTIEKVAHGWGLTMMDAAARSVDENVLASRSTKRLRLFLDLITELARRASEDEVTGLVEHVVKEVGYQDYLEKTYPGQGKDRMDNVRALISATVEYIEENETGTTLQGFLDRLALVADADEVGSRPGVTLMTIHCAKGLEYPVVFLTGLEENLFPHAMSNTDPEDLEEERRLCYVAMTRAKERLLLSHARFRRVQGVQLPSRPSRFLDEIPGQLIEESAPASPRIKTMTDTGDGFPVGAYVIHPRFGAGRIVDREGRGKNLKLTIHFADYGPKRIAPSYTTLRVQSD
jgi:DNA helicase-2/ATP-dependent DNA helicase PcrA